MPAKWTFMVYMAGFNNLSEFATKDLQEMRRVGSTDDVNIVVFIKRLRQKSAHHILVRKNGKDETRERVGNADSGNPQTLLDFIRWAAKTAPAERYALTVWNHGSGWAPDDLDQLYAEVRAERGESGLTERELGVRSNQRIARTLFSTSVMEVLALPSARERAIASDDGTGHSLDTIELNRVLKRAHEDVLDRRLDLLGMDACLMSNLEVAYETEKHVGTVVGSEELEPGDGWPYTAILEDLVANADMDGAALGSTIVDRYIESYRSRPEQWPVTQCAVRANAAGEFVQAFDGLAKALRSHLRSEGAAKIARAQQRSTYFQGELIDVRTLCRELRAAIPGSEVHGAAGAVLDVLKPNGYVIDEGHLGPSVEGCGGVTVYFPYPIPGAPEGNVSPFYKDLRFARSGWDEFLRHYARALRGD